MKKILISDSVDEKCVEILKSAGFDVDRDHVPTLMEINPRFWGSLELAVRAGVDFPLLYARASLGEKLEPVHRYAVGTRCRWMFPGEILRYLTQAKEKRDLCEPS